MRFTLLLAVVTCVTGCGSGGAQSPSAPAPVATPTPTPTATPPVGAVALLGASLPSGSSVPTQALGAGHSAPTLTFRYSVRMEQAATGLLLQVWVRTDTSRCMGAGLAEQTFQPGETKVIESFNVSFAQGNDTPPCTLPYTTNAVEITVADHGVVILSDRFPMTYNFLTPR